MAPASDPARPEQQRSVGRPRVLGVALLAALTLFASNTVGPAGQPRAQARTATAPAALPGFRNGYVLHDGIRIHYVIGGHGPALVLLHGWPETWLAWSTVMPQLARTHTVIACDLRGLGDSGVAPTDDGSYVAPVLAGDVHAVVQALKLSSIDLAGHDWGGAVALSYAAQYRSQVRRLAVLEAPPTSDYLHLVQQRPDTFWWDWFINGPKDTLAESLVSGRERTFYTWFYRQAAGAIPPARVNQYVTAYARPGSSHAGFEYFRQQDQGEQQVDQIIHDTGKITVPVLGVGGRHSMGSSIGTALPRVATNVTTAVVPDADHWVMEEKPGYVAALLGRFFD